MFRVPYTKFLTDSSLRKIKKINKIDVWTRGKANIMWNNVVKSQMTLLPEFRKKGGKNG